MFTHKTNQFEQEIFTIHPGEYYMSQKDIIIATVLGSCISVSLWDLRLAHGGINHFMLPGNLNGIDMIKSPNAKYGMYAMELLYNELLKAGSRKADIRAKVFGGASILRMKSGIMTIPQDNIDFALNYLNKEQIPVIARDTGGVQARKIFFFVKSGKVLLKRIAGSMLKTVSKEEENYLKVIQRRTNDNITLF
ncbi:chemoreceptor glutamine deamidase CheD [Spirochaetota bacterium]